MHYVKQFDINGVATKQVACIELHGKPNAATEGCVGVLGIDMDSPTHEVYKCSAVNGSIYTWELLSSGMSIMSASISGGGVDFVEFPYANIRIPATYVVKVGDLILDKDGYLYQISALNSTYCVASYCTRVVAYGMSAYDLAVNNGFEGTEEEWLLSLQGKGLSVKANKSSCTELGDGYIDTNGDLQILTTLPSTFTNCGQIRGPAGESISVSWSIAYYGVSNSASTRPTSWSSSIPTNIAEGQYLWTRTDIRFSDGATASGYTYSKQGDKGEDGKNGTSVTITNVSESTVDGGENVVTFSDGKKLTVKNGKQGADGKNGTKIVYTEGQYSDVSGTDVVFTYHDIPASTLEVGDFIVSQGNLYQVNYIVASGYQSSLIVKMQGEDGKDGDDYVLTEADKAEIAENVKGVCIPKNQGVANVGKILVVGTDGNLTLADMPEGGASGDIIGTLDESNNILLSGNLADGIYTLKYENANGTYTEIGDLVVSSIVDYAIITTLENCTSSGATSVRGNGSATVTITAKSGYALPDSITVSGASYTWNKTTGNIVLSNPTSDVYITVTAEKTITNFIEYNADNTTDWSIWCNNARIGSDGLYRQSTSSNVTNYIPVQNGDIVYWYDMPINGTLIGLYKSDKTQLSSTNITTQVSSGYIKDATSLNSTTYDGQLTINNADVAYIRFTITREGYTSIFDNDDGIVNIKRNGEWL